MCRVVRSAVCVSFFLRLAFSRLIARPRPGDGVWWLVGLRGTCQSRPPARDGPADRAPAAFSRRIRRPQPKSQRAAARRRTTKPQIYPRADAASTRSFMRKSKTFARTGYFWQRAAQRTPSPRPSPPAQRQRPLDTMGAAESHTAKKQVNVDATKAPRRVRPPPATTQPSRHAGVLLRQARRRRRRQARDPAPDLLLEGGLRGRGGHGDLRLLLCRAGRQVPSQVLPVKTAAGRRVLRG